MTYYLHSIPGRLRVKIPSVKGQVDKANAVQSLLREMNGIESISANTVTGSVVVKYDPALLHSEQILSILKKNSLFDEASAVTMDRAVAEAGSTVGRALSKAFCGWAVGRALEGTSLSFLAVLI
jgi:copper chaperone CopZ